MLSVIVPVYNTAKYIEKCLDSLINQTKKDKIEIILINDGSTDNSDEVIKKYIQALEDYKEKDQEKDNENQIDEATQTASKENEEEELSLKNDN